MKHEVEKYRLCTNCDTNFPEKLWIKNRGCLNCKWDRPDCNFDSGLVKTGDPFPCYIKNRGKILLNGKLAKIYEG